MQETTNYKLKKPEYNEYADIMDINHNMDILDEEVNKKLDKTEKAPDSEKLDGLDSLKFARSYSFFNNDNIPKDVFNNTSHNQSYIGVINYGAEVGFSGNHVKIIYIPHYNDGYGTQIAIPYEGGNYYGVFYRNSIGNKWGDFIELLDTRSIVSKPIKDANTCIESGKSFYCVHNQTANLPLGTVDDGIIIPYMYSNDWGCQLYMTWHGNAIYWRKKSAGTWDRWHCIGGGSWNQELIKDSEQVGKYLRWNKYGQNHVIFDASAGVRPDGQACDAVNSQNVWQNTYPTLMGFNGVATYGLRVDSSRNSDCVAGFPFRNNNGKLEVLIGGEWLSVGAKQYTVVREFNLRDNSQERFDYSGGSGVLRFIKYPTAPDVDPFTQSFNAYYIHLPDIIIDGVSVNKLRYPIFGELEFKNSISIVVQNWSNGGNYGCYGLIQTEK
nr:MAG TPA: tail fiber protein [Caudoviricetes sp.]